MSKAISTLAQFLRKNIFFVLVSLLSPFFFITLMFPYNDFSDYMSNILAEKTQNQLILNFDSLSFYPFKATLKNVQVDNPVFSTLKMEKLAVSPAYSSLFALKLGAELSAVGLFGGDLDLRIEKQSAKAEDAQFIELDLSAEDLNIQQIAKFFSLPVAPTGTLNLSVEPLMIDLNFVKQPETVAKGELPGFSLMAQNIELDPFRVNFFDIPKISLSEISGSGRLNPGRVTISEMKFGVPGKDDLNGKLKGHIDVDIRKIGSQIAAQPRTLELYLDVSLDRQILDLIKPFSAFIEQYKTNTGSGARYLLKLNANISDGRFIPNSMTPTQPF